MADQVFNVTIKGIGDFSDVVSNVNSVQKALTKLKIPDKLGNNLNQNISNFMREYDKYQQKIAGGIKTQGDNNAVNKNLSSMLSSYQKIVNDFNKIKPKDFKEIFKMDEGAFASITNKINTIKESLKDIKIDPSQIEKPLKQIGNLTKSDKIVGKDGLLNTFKDGLTIGGVDGIVQARKAFTELESHFARFGSQMSENTFKTWDKSLGEMRTELEGAEKAAGPMLTKLAESNQELNAVGSKGMSAFRGVQQGLNDTRQEAEKVTDALKNMHSEEFDFNKQVQQIDRQVQSYFGLSQMIRKVGDIARDAFNTVKELDKAMTETAVVTNFSVSDMWNMLPTYTEQANKLGATIKDVYEAATLYYQQGLNTNQAMGLANETLKMARIAGMDAAEATDMMTSALRGFNMEINQASAQKVNDIYSQLAAVTASDTREIGTAMEKTASLAASANMKIETTSAFLAQMIETTREAPENLGTAMKTIIARFQEMKKDPTKLVDSEGVAMDVNKIDTALKSIGVALTNSKGEFRDLDEVFLDISKKWDSLSQGQQRYIATTAAGSRQQSRFIAMMSNYDRTMELVNEANNSAGASQKQFEKTMDSMSSKLNQLKNAWDEFSMGLMNNQILKGGVTALTGFFTIVNKIIDVLSKIPSKPFEGITKSALTLAATLSGLNFAKKFARGSIMAGAGWWKNEGKISENFIKGYGISAKRETQIISPQEMQRQKMQSVYQKLETSPIKPIETQLPIDATAYLEKLNNADLSDEAIAEIKAVIGDGVDVPVDVRMNINHGTLGPGNEDFFIPIKTNENGEPLPDYNPKLQQTNKTTEQLSKNFNTLGTSISQAGYILQTFGSQLGPLGGVLSSVGSVMMSFGTTISTMIPAFQAAQAAGKGFMASMAAAVGPMTMIIGAAIAIGGAIYLLDKAYESDKEKLERLTETANTASDAYDSLKQSVSELKNSLEEIQSNEESFEGLIVGTTTFNDKLTETNQKIDELLQKYPELNKYLTIDKNGLKHISKEGIDFIKKQQEQLVGNASAQNILQNAYLKAEQDRQKAKEIENKINSSSYSSTKLPGDQEQITRKEEYIKQVKLKTLSVESEETKELKRQAAYYEESARNAERLAEQQAIAASLTSIEASDRDRMASMYVDSFEAAKKRAEAITDEKEMLQTYADYYGYTYDAISNKVFNGKEEVEINKEALKSTFPTLAATLELQPRIEDFDKIEDEVNQKFSDGLELGAKNGENILSGVLSGDIETNPKLIKELVRKTPEEIKDALSELTDTEMATLMGLKKEDFAGDQGDKLRKEYANTVQEHIQKTFEAQNKIYEELGAKMAKTEGTSVSNLARPELALKKYEEDIKSIADRIGELSFEQVNILNNAAEGLEKNVGLDAMDTFFDKAIPIYELRKDEISEEFNNILADINWESASSRLAGYTQAINSSKQEIKDWGAEMKNSADEANILGEAFDEFVSGDWAELSENADDFKNSLGEIDGAGILKASEQSSSLKNLLDSGAASATGVAMALQGIEDGKYSVGAVNGVVLQLLSSLNRLEDASLRAHNFISDFDAGIDTGEGEDFVKDNAKKAQEYYDNGEWGNQQLEQYIKAAAGEERWNKVLKKNKGDLEATTGQLIKYVNTFKDGFGPAWDQIVNDKTIGGKDAKTKIEKFAKNNEDLLKKYNSFDAFYNKDGYLNFEIGELSTKDLQTYFQEIYGVSKEYADLMLQDMLNYSGTLKADLQKNDLLETVRSSEFQENRINGKGLVLTDEELKIFEEAGGDLKKLAQGAGYEDIKNKNGKVVKTAEAQLKENQFRVYDEETGERRNDYPKLFSDYEKTLKNEEKNIKSISDVNELKTNGKLDLNKIIADAQSKHLDDTQAMRVAYELYQQKEGKGFLYEGMEVKNGLQTPEEFEAALKQMTETSQWVQVGETIGQQIVNAFEAANLLDNLENGKEPLKEAAFSENEKGEGQFNEKNFTQTIDKLSLATQDKERQQQDITKYLSQSQDVFKKMSSEDQTKALSTVVEKLSSLSFKPEEITKTISDGLGVSLAKKEGGHYQDSLLTNKKTGAISLDTDSAKKTLEEQFSDVKAEVKEVTVPDKPIEMDVTGKLTSIAIMSAAAKGQNNSNSAFNRIGTMARGSRKGYTISGRPTLTGEEGEELVWEPKRNEAYMVGSRGPQFANISKDAVVWNADQTKRIKKNSGSVGRIGTGARGIVPIGTMAEGTGGLKIPGTGTLDVMANIIGFNGLNEDKKEQGLTIDVTAVVNTLDVKEEAKTIKDLKGEITAEKVNKSGQIQGEPVKLSGVVENITVTKEKQEKKEQPQKTVTTTTNVKTTSDGKAQKEINNIRHNGVVRVKTQATPDAQNAINKIKANPVTVHINPKFDGSWEKTATVKVNTQKAARGKNNHIQYRSAPIFGSAAKGRYGTIGPKDKGGLTLTGEEGYEIAWLPSESRSIILGTDGPQMISLPNDAVVYTHEQSEDILKRKGIPAGSHKKPSTTGRKQQTDDSDDSSNKSKGSKNQGKASSNNKKKKKNTNNKKEESNTAAISNIIVWWENITRLADATQRKADKNQKTYEKYLKEMRATLKTTGTVGGGNAFINNTKKAINLYNEQLKRATLELTNLDKGTADQQAKKKNATKNAYNAEQGGAVQISYTKGGKKKKTVNKTVATAGYIKEQDGTYIIDQAALNTVKNKDERKALKDALEKEINDRISKRNSAEDNIEKAQEALEKFSEELYNTFFAWENELTKIWNITQKIDQAQARLGRNDAYDELLKAQLSTGKLTAGTESRNKDLTNFRNRLETQNQLLKDRQEAITASQKNLQNILNSEDERKILANVNSKLNADAQAAKKADKKGKLDQAKQAKINYDNAVKNKKKTQADLDKVQAKINKLNKKKKLNTTEKKELKNLKSQRDKLKKQRDNYNKIINDNKTLASQVNKLQQEYNNTASGTALNDTQRDGYTKYKKELENQISAEDMARKFTKITRRADGTIDVQFDTDAFEKERLNGNITSDMAKAVQDWVKKLQEASTDLQKNYEELTKEVTEYYTQLESLQDEWADYGKELTEISEVYEKEKIDKIKQLSDEVKKTLDRLLDYVKRKLDERRKQEENVRTEQEISQKQQRLAALRADTSGGHQVEIAQLEKEIADAQQNYQNSLEDQLLDKLQQQADLAAEQRERQIELQEALVSSVNNIEKVNEWMANPEAYEDEIRAAYYSKNNYDNVTDAEQARIETDFNEFYNGLLTNQQKQEELNAAIENIESIVAQIEKYLQLQNLTLEEAKGKGYTAKQAQEQFNASLSELRTQGKYTFEDFQKSGYSNQQIKQAGFSASDFKSKNVSYANAKAAGYSLDELEKGGYSEATAEKAKIAADKAAANKAATAKAAAADKQAKYNAYINKLKEIKKIKPANVKKDHVNTLFDLGAKAGYGKATVLLHLVGGTGGSDPFSWKNIFKAIIDAKGIDRYNLVKTWKNGNGTLADAIKTLKSNPNTYAEIKKHKNYKNATALKFASGGLADYTGPAWLDGTPSKPELVLNSVDTKNFIALRDILSKVMKSSNSNNNSYANSEFNININVNKIADDYDVDKVITKVKKEIIKSAGYRNVTQVRKLR